MVKLIKGGNETLPSSPPPAGIRFTCYYCQAVMETTGKDKEAVPAIIKYEQFRFAGWKIPCIQCGRECDIMPK